MDFPQIKLAITLVYNTFVYYTLICIDYLFSENGQLTAITTSILWFLYQFLYTLNHIIMRISSVNYVSWDDFEG